MLSENVNIFVMRVLNPKAIISNFYYHSCGTKVKWNKGKVGIHCKII